MGSNKVYRKCRPVAGALFPDPGIDRGTHRFGGRILHHVPMDTELCLPDQLRMVVFRGSSPAGCPDSHPDSKFTGHKSSQCKSGRVIETRIMNY